MQDVTSFVKAQSPLSLSTTGAESKKGSSPKTNLFSLLLAGLSQAKAEIKLDSTPSDVKTAPLKEEPKNTKESPKKAKSVDEHLLADLLKVVESLKTNSPLPLLPTLKSSSQLEKVLNNQTALKEFAEVKNIGDLMALSKKYTLGLEKLTFTKESVETLQKEFPTLAKSTFFEALTHDTEALDLAKSNDKTPVEKALVFNPLEKNIKKSEPQETPSALKELMSKEPKNSKEEDVREKNALKESPMLDAHSKATAKSAETIVVQKVISPLKEESKTDKKPLPEPFALKDALEESSELPIERKPAALTRTSEPKAETSSLQKGVVEAILQTIKVEKPHTQKVAEQPEPIQTETLASQPTATSQQLSDEMLDITPLSNEAKVTTKQEIATKQVIAPKESLGQFANDLKEKIEAYKPPIMKVELSLFPKSLGEVDVTLLTRGNNLHVNITSNANTMTLFTQNQAEFKNALVNMGFTNLEMNFSDQRGNESGQQHQQKKSSETFFDELSESTGSELATIELVVPRYV